MSNLYKNNHKDISSISTPSPISFKSRNLSPVVSSLQLLPPRSRPYKSPNSTPTTSPMPVKILSFDEVSECFSEKKESKQKDQVYYLRQKIQIQEKRIQLLEEENKRLSQMKRPDYWEKELLRRNDDIRKLENQLKYFMELAAERSESDRLLDTIVEKDNKIAQLEAEVSELSSKADVLEKKNEELKKENKKLAEISQNHSNCLKKEECEILLTQIQELETALEYQAKENRSLKEENERARSDNKSGSLAYFSQDINKIKREMSKLARILDDVIKGKEITLKGLLGIDMEYKNDPLKQITVDLQSIKSDLNQVLTMISDIHAEQCANIVCRNQ